MKRLTQTLAFCLLTAFTAVAQKNYVSEVWVSDLGNGKYKNPVLYADYSDPDACRVGDDFYMTSSSFNCLPGLQILHSKDLVNWTIIGAAVPNVLTPIETPERPEHGNRIWAPAIRYSLFTENNIHVGRLSWRRIIMLSLPKFFVIFMNGIIIRAIALFFFPAR